MPTWKHIHPSGAILRCRHAKPVFRGTCVLFDGGTNTPFGETDRAPAYILATVQQLLLVGGYRTLEISFPEKLYSEPYLSAEDLEIRTSAARELLLSLDREEDYAHNFAWVGYSSGGLVLLRILSEPIETACPPCAAICISTVIDCHFTIFSSIQNLLFFYGQYDHIAYVDGPLLRGGTIPSSEFSQYPFSNLTTRKTQLIQSEIIKGVGHAMRDAHGSTSQAADLVYQHLTRHLLDQEGT